VGRLIQQPVRSTAPLDLSQASTAQEVVKLSKLTRIVTLSLLGLAIAAGPAAGPAVAGVIDYGAIANCRYQVTESGKYGWTEALLKKIAVQPPTMPKKAGNKSVGWRFVVERSLDRENTPWKVTYRSPIQRAARSADLTPMRVAITVPPDNDTPNGQQFVWHRVTIKMFWYGAGGSVQTKLSHVMNDMHVIVDGEDLIDSYCPGLAQQFFD
jgi:hypothetical protein